MLHKDIQTVIISGGGQSYRRYDAITTQCKHSVLGEAA